jgi:hypothetical protein
MRRTSWPAWDQHRGIAPEQRVPLLKAVPHAAVQAIEERVAVLLTVSYEPSPAEETALYAQVRHHMLAIRELLGYQRITECSRARLARAYAELGLDGEPLECELNIMHAVVRGAERDLEQGRAHDPRKAFWRDLTLRREIAAAVAAVFVEFGLDQRRGFRDVRLLAHGAVLATLKLGVEELRHDFKPLPKSKRLITHKRTRSTRCAHPRSTGNSILPVTNVAIAAPSRRK